MMKLSRRNPLLRGKEEKGFNNMVGSLYEDIESQELQDIEGGSSLACVSVTLWVHDKITELARCGAVLTTSAECSRTGNPC